MLDTMIADPRHGWSIGTFGAIGEFARDDDEPAEISRDGDTRTIVTARGGMRVRLDPAIQIVAYDTLASDGETWGQSVAFCLPEPAQIEQGRVIALGRDDALRDSDRGAYLFDLGVGRGHVRFCVRTRDEPLIVALERVEGENLFGEAGRAVMPEILRAQPHRVLQSPIGRVEVYSRIPTGETSSPEGPHTHLLPKLLAARRTHAANAPIPDGLQPVLMLHPRSPWRDGLGHRVPFDVELDDLFEDLMARFGLPQDLAVRLSVEEAIEQGVAPERFAWPETRRGRAEARITLRRLARSAGVPAIEAWRQRYDRAPEPTTEDELAHA
ncbi:DUF6925 family protein [Sphingomonas bacterium]|uniref:DUF6925 family protein n=1 Tax=Sphingomonas bacterium TaxID=1895847 RepID=UPI0020C73322|nr:hypothetical protein [Sphingomonas bacterium]